MGENANSLLRAKEERREGGRRQTGSMLPICGQDAHMQPTDAPPSHPTLRLPVCMYSDKVFYRSLKSGVQLL